MASSIHGATLRLSVVALAALLVVYGCILWAFMPEAAAWRRGPPAPGERVQSVAAVVDHRLYVFGGFQQEQETSSTTFIYDVTSGQWRAGEDAPIALSHTSVAIDGDIVWIAGGLLGNAAQEPSHRVLKYDTTADSWSEGPSLPLAIGGGGLVRHGRRLHYIGGFVDALDVDGGDFHWILDLDGDPVWRNAAPLPLGRGHAGVVALGEYIYVIGGSVRHGVPGSSTRSVSAYDVGSDTWARVHELPFPRSHFEAATVAYEGKIYVLGGRDDTSEQLSQMELRDITVYDPSVDTWTHGLALPHPLRSPASRVIEDTIYILHGSTFWSEAPQDGLWIASCENSKGSPCPTGRSQIQISEIKGRIRSFGKRYVNLLPTRLQRWLFLGNIADR